jgi:hypothetical protein
LKRGAVDGMEIPTVIWAVLFIGSIFGVAFTLMMMLSLVSGQLLLQKAVFKDSVIVFCPIFVLTTLMLSGGGWIPIFLIPIYIFFFVVVALVFLTLLLLSAKGRAFMYASLGSLFLAFINLAHAGGIYMFDFMQMLLYWPIAYIPISLVVLGFVERRKHLTPTLLVALMGAFSWGIVQFGFMAIQQLRS